MIRFIIATNNATAEQRNAITDFVKEKGWAFWHHFEDFWMVVTDDYSHMTSKQLFNELTDIPVIGKQFYIIVIRMAGQDQPMTHFGFGPPKGWEWTAKCWSRVG